MTDEQELPQTETEHIQAESLEAQPVETAAADTSADKTRQRKPWLSAFLFFVLFAFAVGSGYLHWQYYRDETRQAAVVAQENQTLLQQLEQQSRQIDQQSQQLKSIQDSNTALRQKLQQQSDHATASNEQLQSEQQVLRQQLEAQHQRLLQLSSTNSENWELAEALYLTRLANQRLAMEQNREAALALLEGADKVLARQQNPRLFSIREVVAKDIAALKIVPAIDREGLFLQLAALHEQVAHLPANRPLHFQLDELSETTPVTEEQSVWQKVSGSFRHAFGKLDNYVRKVDLEGPVKPLLAPEQQHSIQLAVSLNIESAQIALLRGQPLVFKNALAQAQRQINVYYPESSQRQELVAALQILQDESIKPALPDISESYVRLNQFVQTQAAETTNTESDNGDEL